MFSAATKSAHPSGSVNWIDDVFSTWLYTGSGSTQAINNGIDLSTYGGLTWFKSRSAAYGNYLYTTDLTANYYLTANGTDALSSSPSGTMQFDSTGFTVGNNYYLNNLSNTTYASWSFRKQAKFFDVVTWTGNGSNSRQISHSLKSVPGCIMIKSTSDGGAKWIVWHRSIDTSNTFLSLNSTSAKFTQTNTIDADITSTYFTVQSNVDVNNSGETYVAYLFAHDAGGFGTAGTDNVISCGSFTTNSAGEATVNLGYEPQYVLWKITDTTGSWGIKDSMRGIYVDPAPNESPVLFANTSSAESQSASIQLTSTGFRTNLSAQVRTYIYIAIRRPMKPPTSGTSVFKPTYSYNPTLNTVVTTNFPQDLIVAKKTQFGDSGNTDAYWNWQNRLTGYAPDAYTSPATLFSNSTLSESSSIAPAYYKITNNKSTIGSFVSGWENIIYNFKRASGFFDIVCYTGNGTNGTTITHNLTSQPELLIVKKRSDTGDWWVLSKNNGVTWKEGKVNSYNAFTDASPYLFGNGTSFVQPTSTQFTLASGGEVNGSAQTYVAYLFATVAGVSKVGSYTGNGGQGKVIDCGFTGGARFVMIKRTNSAGDWFVWDTARGIVSGSDPFLRLNTQQIEASDDSIDPNSSGFTVNQDNIDINVNGASYIFLAIA